MRIQVTFGETVPMEIRARDGTAIQDVCGQCHVQAAAFALP